MLGRHHSCLHSLMLASCLGGMTLSACETPNLAPANLRQEQEEVPRATSWGDFQMTRHDRDGLEVLTRARLIASVVLENDALPPVDAIDKNEIEQWEERARADRYREGAIRFRIADRDVLARYRPATDRLTISAMDTRVRPDNPAELDPGIGKEAALNQARECLAALEEHGVLGRKEFSTEPSSSSSHPVHFEDESWVESYSFMFNPELDGLRLQSAEVVITVNAWAGMCQRITVGGQVKLKRQDNARVALADAKLASEEVRAQVFAATPGVREVHVDGEFGYYLPVDQTTAVVPPRYIARYATESGTSDMPALSRSFLAGLSLDSNDASLLNLLGPL